MIKVLKSSELTLSAWWCRTQVYIFHSATLIYYILTYLSRSLFRRMDKTKPTLLRRKRAKSVKKSLFFQHFSGDLHPRDHVLLSLSVEVSSQSILHNYKLGSFKTLLSLAALNNCTRNSALYGNNALSVWSNGCLWNSLNIQMKESYVILLLVAKWCSSIQRSRVQMGGGSS